MNSLDDADQIIDQLRAGGIGVMPTDTIYGLVGLALDPAVVERLYTLKGRNASKPFIILIDSLETLPKLGITLAPNSRRFLNEHWPGPVSVILPCPDNQLLYLHRGTRSLAVRLPDTSALRHLISQVGPLIATSVNPEGQLPATSIQEAQDYFGDSVDFYRNGGEMASEASTIVDLTGREPQIVRQPTPDKRIL